MKAIEVQHLHKSFGQLQALSDVSFSVGKGELFGLIGADGAGKSSLFNILVTLSPFTAGTAYIEGFSVQTQSDEIRKIVGYMPGTFSLYQDLTVEENLLFFASIFKAKVEDNWDLIRNIWLQIEPFKNRQAGKLSGGMKQKLALCCALVHRPKILFLDEPTTGVDPVSRREFWQMLQAIKGNDITILVSTPYMDEAVMCDKVALIQKGKILTVDTPTIISQQFSFELFSVRAESTFKLMHQLSDHPDIHSCYQFGQTIHIAIKQSIAESDLLHILQSLDSTILTCEPIDPTIEDAFIELMRNRDESNN